MLVVSGVVVDVLYGPVTVSKVIDTEATDVTDETGERGRVEKYKLEVEVLSADVKVPIAVSVDCPDDRLVEYWPGS